jgi:hypothetical protein
LHKPSTRTCRHDQSATRPQHRAATQAALPFLHFVTVVHAGFDPRANEKVPTHPQCPARLSPPRARRGIIPHCIDESRQD